MSDHPDASAEAVATPGRETLWQQVRSAYLDVDPRSLGLFRIVFALVLLLDLVRRIPGLTTWYTEDGLMPADVMLRHPPRNPMFSLLFTASRPEEVAVGFAIVGAVYVGFLIGWRTRLLHVLTLVALTSLHSRVIPLQNGGDRMLGILCFWSLFFPLGARYSVDALLERTRGLAVRAPRDLDELAARAPTTRPHRSLAMTAILVQLAVAYQLNTMAKTGVSWLRGDAIHYILFQSRTLTWFGEVARPILDPHSHELTWLTLAFERTVALCLILPLPQPWIRRATIVLVVLLHVGILAIMNVGLFSVSMMAYTPLLLSRADWEWFERRFVPPPRPRRVFVDPEHGLALRAAALLAVLDRRQELSFSDLAADDVPESVAAERDGALVVLDAASGATWTGSRAFAEALGATPSGRFVAPIFRFAPIAVLADRMFASERARNLALLAPLRVGLPASTLVLGLREFAVVAWLAILATELLGTNPAIPPAYRVRQPRLLHTLVYYPQLYQSWNMYSPDPPFFDEALVVDALTADGRHVDPFNAEGAVNVPERMDPDALLPTRLDQDEFWADYIRSIRQLDEYKPALESWILRYPTRTDDPRDEIVSFQAWVVSQRSPAPGNSEPFAHQKHLFLEYPGADDRRPRRRPRR